MGPNSKVRGIWSEVRFYAQGTHKIPHRARVSAIAGLPREHKTVMANIPCVYRFRFGFYGAMRK